MDDRENLKSLEERFLALRRKAGMPWWKAAYGEFLIRRASEYQELGRLAERDISLERLRSWLNLQGASDKSTQGGKDVPARADISFCLWNERFLRREMERLRGHLERWGHWIPAAEKSVFENHLTQARHRIENRQWEQAYTQIKNLRVMWVRRMTRAHRAWFARAAHSAQRHRDGEKTVALHIGPYNHQWTLRRTLELIGERDPIWVEDLIELYSELFRYAERLGSAETRRRP